MQQCPEINLLRRMVSIPSPSGQEALLASFLQCEMKQLGFHSFIDEVGNIIGEKGDPQHPTIMLLGHMDTVGEPIEVYIEGSQLYGRGTVDAKGPLATLILAAAQNSDAPAHLVVVGAVEEETPQSRGAHHLLDRYQPDAVIIGEPSGWSNVVLGYKGRMGLHYTIKRPLCHPASPDEKATEVASTFWHKLTCYLSAQRSDTSVFYHTTASLLQFTGTMEEAYMHIDCRMGPNFDLATFEAFLHDIQGDAQLSLDECTPCVLMDRSVPTIRSLTNTIRKHQATVKYKLKTGTSDMNIVRQRWNVPMVAYGPGDSSLDHTPNEHTNLDEYLLSIGILRDALTPLAEELATTCHQTVYTQEEEEALNRRLEALGYLE